MENKSCCGKCKDKCLWGGCLCETKPLCPCHKQGEESNYCRPVNEPMPVEGKDYTVTTASAQPTQPWEERFDDRWWQIENPDTMSDDINRERRDIKSFISTVLQEAREEAHMKGYETGRIKCLVQHKGAGDDEVRNLMNNARQQERAEIVKLVEEVMFQLRENGIGETYKTHKLLSDLRTLINQRK